MKNLVRVVSAVCTNADYNYNTKYSDILYKAVHIIINIHFLRFKIISTSKILAVFCLPVEEHLDPIQTWPPV